MHRRIRSAKKILPVIFLSIFIVQYSCAPKKHLQYSRHPEQEIETGIASWYGPDFHGKRTANGEIYNMHGMTAAHKTLPLGTHVLVTNLENRRSVEVRINDRGPFIKGRIIDLSYAAAQSVDMVGSGTAMVKVEVLRKPKHTDPQYTLQVGSYTERKNAVNLKKELNKKYKDVYIVTVKISNV